MSERCVCSEVLRLKLAVWVQYNAGIPQWRASHLQVLANMLANAVKFTETGEIVVTADVEALSEGDTSGCQRVHMTIKDTGIGIDADSMLKLFQCFRQGHESMSRKYGGTGTYMPAIG